MEVWKEVPGYEDKYEVSSQGRVRNIQTGRVLRQQFSDKGYHKIKLTQEGMTREYRVHRLVAMAFLPNPDNLPQINHIDENKDNNSVENLEWCDNDYNNHYGTGKKRSGEKRKKPIIGFDGVHKLGTFFPSALDASVYLSGRKQSCIAAVLKGRNKTAFGYRWEYCTPEDLFGNNV